MRSCAGKDCNLGLPRTRSAWVTSLAERTHVVLQTQESIRRTDRRSATGPQEQWRLTKLPEPAACGHSHGGAGSCPAGHCPLAQLRWPLLSWLLPSWFALARLHFTQAGGGHNSAAWPPPPGSHPHMLSRSPWVSHLPPRRGMRSGVLWPGQSAPHSPALVCPGMCSVTRTRWYFLRRPDSSLPWAQLISTVAWGFPAAAT